MQKTIVIDFDETIVYGTTPGDAENIFAYSRANEELIDKMREFKEAGYRIIIFTSRGMLSAKNNKHLAELKYRFKLEEWLANHDVPYDKLIFGKPYAVYYVDDKALRPEEFICKKP